MPFLRKFSPLATVAIALSILYLYDLTGVGVLSTDEPRYAAIGRSMAFSGDLITPRLWGSPWFEKPPALYWMTAASTKLGAGIDLAGRLPVALLSLGFLCLFFLLLGREFGCSHAFIATAMLATSAGWLAYSELCLTDIPVAVFFSTAVLLAVPLVKEEQAGAGQVNVRMALIGAFLGLGMLSKGLVPLSLALPFFWFLRSRWQVWWISAVACLSVALPWYVAVYLRNGRPFLEEFFIRHHFERLYSASLQHVQPWYFYLPVLLAALFPWTPLLALFPGKSLRQDRRLQFLGTIVLFGIVLFSASLNKLPGYLLPLLPSLFALFASYFTGRSLSQISRIWLWACAVLIACIPFVAQALPALLSTGRFSFPVLRIDRTGAFYSLAPLAVMLLGRRSWLVPLLVLCIVSSGLYVKTVCFPLLDQEVSARSVWNRIKPIANDLCDAGTNRNWIYGLNFYRGSAIPTCQDDRFHYSIRSVGQALPVISRSSSTSASKH